MCQSFAALIKDHFVFTFWVIMQCFECADSQIRRCSAEDSDGPRSTHGNKDQSHQEHIHVWHCFLSVVPSKGQAGLIGQQGISLYEKGPQKAQK